MKYLNIGIQFCPISDSFVSQRERSIEPIFTYWKYRIRVDLIYR